MKFITETIIGTICLVMSWLFGDFTPLIGALIIFVIIDYISGVMCAIINKKLNSKVGAKGICKKIFIFMIISIGHIIDTNIIGNGDVLMSATILFYLANEGISLIENASIIGLPVPKKIKDTLMQLKTKEDNDVS